jgi:hypothetical protein
MLARYLHPTSQLNPEGAGSPLWRALRNPDWQLARCVHHAVITENLVCMPTPSAEENDRGGLEVAERRVLDRNAGSAKRNPVSAREEIALVNTTNGSYSRRSAD